MPQCKEPPTQTADVEAQAIDRVYDFLRDFAGFDAMQIHFVGEAIERSGLKLRQG